MGRLRIDRLASRTARLIDGDGYEILERCHVADRWPARLVGLLATGDLGAGEGVWIEPCRAIHTFGMRGAIDVLFVDREGRVVRIVPDVQPGSRVGHRSARAVIEAPSGALAGLLIGARLLFVNE